MGVMDEKTPIGGSSTQMPQSPSQTPNWFIQALKQLGMGGGGQGQGMASMPRPAGVISPAIVPQSNPGVAPPVTVPQGGQTPRIPQLPQVNSTAAGYQGPSAPLPIGGGPTEFSTKGGRDAAIIKGSVDNILGTLHQYKVDQFQKQAAEAEQIWGNYLSLNSAAEGEQDPQKKQQLQKLAQQMLQDKKVAKVLEKAQKDPMSGPGVGLQRAIQGSSQRAMAQAQLEQVYAQIQNQMAQAAYHQSRTPQTPEERGVAMGTLPSADTKAQMQLQSERQKEDIQFKRDQLGQQKELTLQRLEDQRNTAQDRMQLQRQLAELKHQDNLARLDLMQMMKQQNSKMPQMMISRVNQAQLIQEQIGDMRRMLDDPDINKFIGPTKGTLLGPIVRRYDGKIQNFYASQQSLNAMLPILHGYRGGAQTHKMFEQSMGTLGFNPESYRGTLDALDKLAGNVVSEAKKAFPNDPSWGVGVPPAQEPTASSTSSKDVIVVKPEDLK